MNYPVFFILLTVEFLTNSVVYAHFLDDVEKLPEFAKNDRIKEILKEKTILKKNNMFDELKVFYEDFEEEYTRRNIDFCDWVGCEYLEKKLEGYLDRDLIDKILCRPDFYPVIAAQLRENKILGTGNRASRIIEKHPSCDRLVYSVSKDGYSIAVVDENNPRNVCITNTIGETVARIFGSSNASVSSITYLSPYENSGNSDRYEDKSYMKQKILISYSNGTGFLHTGNSGVFLSGGDVVKYISQVDDSDYIKFTNNQSDHDKNMLAMVNDKVLVTCSFVVDKWSYESDMNFFIRKYESKIKQIGFLRKHHVLLCKESNGYLHLINLLNNRVRNADINQAKYSAFNFVDGHFIGAFDGKIIIRGFVEKSKFSITHEQPVSCLCYDELKGWLGIGFTDGSIQIWENERDAYSKKNETTQLKYKQIVSLPRLPETRVQKVLQIAFTYSAWIAIGLEDNTVHLRSAEERSNEYFEVIQVSELSNDAFIEELRFLQNNTVLMIRDSDQKLYFYDLYMPKSKAGSKSRGVNTDPVLNVCLDTSNKRKRLPCLDITQSPSPNKKCKPPQNRGIPNQSSPTTLTATENNDEKITL
ncbi:hypothetical protein CI610_00948 [invertebrate metagenome]|uniref:Uncharacterized protein n=1 Tax=invertebrate metagenome TaxID=1711999 RepID=A0A2H9TA31_9ZZZZ